MKAVGYTRFTPGQGAEVLEDLDVPEPGPGPHDLLVEVRAVAVNPRDSKARRVDPGSPEQPRILGWDCAGVVVGTGESVERYAVGDEVYYAGASNRAGCFSERHCVDERIVGRKPGSLDFPAAAALPLVSLTAYEMLFDRLGIAPGERDGALLVLGGAGGVPSLALQLARQLTDLTVVGSASRPESRTWVERMGAHHVVNHRNDLVEEFGTLGLGENPLRYAFSTHTSTDAWAQLAALLAPQGRIGIIDDPEPLDLKLIKMKSGSVHWESMFTRAVFGTPDLARQREILDHVADLADEGKITSPATEHLGVINADSIRQAQQAIEADAVVGKITLAGF